MKCDLCNARCSWRDTANACPGAEVSEKSPGRGVCEPRGGVGLAQRPGVENKGDLDLRDRTCSRLKVRPWRPACRVHWGDGAVGAVMGYTHPLKGVGCCGVER